MPRYMYLKKIMVTSAKQQGEYRAICLFRKLENRKKGRDLQKHAELVDSGIKFSASLASDSDQNI